MGICTDTGQFCYSGTNAHLKYAENFVKQAVILLLSPMSSMKRKAGQNPTLQKFGQFQMEFDDRVCIGNIRGQFYRKWNQTEDAENFVDYARSLEGGNRCTCGRPKWKIKG